MAKRKRTQEAQTLTATQLRNARKRAAKKRGKEEAKCKQDPSLVHIDDPLSAPTVVEAKRFFRDLGRKLPLHLGPLEGWRTSAKLAVRAGPSGPEIGLFAPKSHKICRVDGCAAHHPSINEALDAISSACRSVGVKGYDEDLGKGDLRYLKLEVQRSSGKVQLTLVWHASSKQEAGKLLRRLLAALQKREIWYAIWANFHAPDKHVSRILSYDEEAWVQLAGPKRVMRETLLNSGAPYEAPQLCFPPYVFRQANLCAFEGIVAAVRRFVPKGSEVVELYGGVGTIGLHLADLVSSLVCSDENPHNRLCFRRGAKGLPEDLRPRLTYERGDAAAQVGSIPSADLVIVDPPRKGLDDVVIDALTSRNPGGKPRRLIYVSCGFPAFCRDARRLLEAGWKAKHAEGFVLFPGADHLETFCVFDRG